MSNVSSQFHRPARLQLAIALMRFGSLALMLLATFGALSQEGMLEPREAFNAGTAKLRENKLREAEALLENALAAQVEALQPAALYNLGHTRFRQGDEELKKAPPSAVANARGAAANRSAADALTGAERALSSGEIANMVASYIRGRGARKELRAALRVVQQAIEIHGAVLNRWRRASGDFLSSAELNPRNPDPKENAQIVDRNIARLIDSLRELQQLANAMGEKNRELKEKLEQLKGKIPAPDMPPGPGDDEEEEEEKSGRDPGRQEAAPREGRELSLSPEQAGWLLEGYKLDTERRLPMGQNSTTDSKSRNRPDW